MVLRIALAVVLGGGIGLIIGLIGRSAGGQCPLACNPYVSTGLGVIIGLVLASRGSSVEAQARSANLLKLDTEAAYQQAVAAPGRAALVEFYTPQCLACRKQLPVLNTLADRFAGKVTVAVVNAAALRDVARQQGVSAFPTMFIFKDGQRLETIIGLTTEKELAQLLEKYIAERPGPARAQA
jgi:thioredoxin 1